MITIKTQNPIVSIKWIAFPDQREVEQIIQDMAINDVLSIMQTPAHIPEHPCLVEQKTFRTSFIDLTKDSEVLFAEMRSMTRRYIRKAQKMEDRIQILRNTADSYEAFIKFYNRFARMKSHVSPLSEKSFRSYLDVADVFLLYFDRRPICGRLNLRDEQRKRARLAHAPTSRMESKEDAKLSGTLNRYLHWYELQTYKSEGFAIYDFGGIGQTANSIADFKLSFGGYPVQENNYLFAGRLGRLRYRARQSIKKVRDRLMAGKREVQ